MNTRTSNKWPLEQILTTISRQYLQIHNLNIGESSPVDNWPDLGDVKSVNIKCFFQICIADNNSWVAVIKKAIFRNGIPQSRQDLEKDHFTQLVDFF